MYSFESKVRYSETNETGRLSVLGLLNYMQDCCTFHSESLGLGVEHIREAGLGWLLAAWDIEIAALPKFNEKIVVNTWPTYFKGIYAGRNFTLDGEDGFRYVRADSLWFMYDASLGRPSRPVESELAPYDDQMGEPLEMSPLQRKLAVDGTGVPADPITVTRAHLDTNHHVNNAQYVEMALGALPEATSVSSLEVQYKKAAVLGDVIVPMLHEDADGHTIELTGNDDVFAVVRVR